MTRRGTLILADLSVALFGLVLLVGGAPSMIFGAPYAQQMGGLSLAYLWMVTCLAAQAVGALCAFVALRNVGTR